MDTKADPVGLLLLFVALTVCQRAMEQCQWINRVSRREKAKKRETNITVRKQSNRS